MADPKSELLSNTTMAAPSLTGLTLWLAGKDINFWVGAAGIAFIALQAAYLVWKWRRDIRRERLGIFAPDTE